MKISSPFSPSPTVAEARGGATRSDVIIADRPIHFPKVIQPNVLVCLTQQAYTKFSSIIRPGGLLITDSRYVKIQQQGGRAPGGAADVRDRDGEDRPADRLQHLHARAR